MTTEQKERNDVSIIVTATSAAKLVGEDGVLLWRVSQLEQGGYSAVAAAKIGEWGHIDLHKAVEILAQGCPEQTALEILLPFSQSE